MITIFSPHRKHDTTHSERHSTDSKPYKMFLSMAIVLTSQLTISLIGTFTATAQAQIIPVTPLQSLDNSFTQTAPQDFFEQGRSRLEQQIESLLQRQTLPTGELLEIDPELLPQTQESILQREKPDASQQESHPQREKPDASRQESHPLLIQKPCKVRR